MSAYLDIIRPKNLLIVAVTQLLFQYFIVDPTFRSSGIFWTLSPINFSLLMLSTVLIAAGGYIINDIYDQRIDKINKSNTQVIGNQLTENQSWDYYKLIVLSGALVSFFVARQIDQTILFLIYPAAVGLLYFYSWKAKHWPLIGNILVSAFIGVVIFILLFAEREGLLSLKESNYGLYTIFMAFAIFIVAQAFISNLIREIVKDIEDIDGDRQGRSRTLPLAIGIRGAKYVALGFGGCMLLGLYAWWLLMGEWMNRIHLGYFIAGLVIPLIILMIMLALARQKMDFHKISQLLKVYMLCGILYLLFYPI